MRELSEEYLTLFNSVTDALETLEQLRVRLQLAQQMAEEAYLRGEADQPEDADMPIPLKPAS